MDIFWDEMTRGLTDGFGVKVAIRITAAIVLGAILGFQRERAGKPAGIKTHTLATLGTAIFVIACQSADMGADALSRVIQGIVTGIGFLGAGAILKLDEEKMVKGLTTAAMIWVSAAVGVAAGLGAVGLASIITVLTVIVISGMSAVERGFFTKSGED